MVDRNAIELTESIDEAERLFIEDFDTWDMTGYYLYSKYWRAGVSAHIGTGGREAILLHLEGLLDDGLSLPRPSTIEQLRSKRSYHGWTWAIVDVSKLGDKAISGGL